MRAALTGATGLLGANLAAALLAAGHEVVATKRASSDTSHLGELAVDWVTAGLDDEVSLAAAFAGVDVVFHCAAAVSVQFEVEPWIEAANVTGTENVIAAVRAQKEARLVHCSSVVAVGVSDDGEPCNEQQRWNLPEHGLDDAYAKTKRRAEELVVAAAKDGLDAVVVNPTYMLGPLDVRPSSGKLLLDLLKGKVPGRTAGKNNFVDVRDVARGMLAAAERGRRGERYILGGHNLGYGEIMDLTCDLAGRPRVRFNIPKPLAQGFGVLGGLHAKLTGREPLINSATVRWGYTDRFIFTSAKAEEELDYVVSPLEPAINAAMAWRRERDML